MTYTTLISLLKCIATLLGTAILKTIVSWYACLHNRTIVRGYTETKKSIHSCQLFTLGITLSFHLEKIKAWRNVLITADLT